VKGLRFSVQRSEDISYALWRGELPRLIDEVYVGEILFGDLLVAGECGGIAAILE
jgi:hypothetical protein